MLRSKKKIGDLECQIGGNQIVTVAEHDNGEIVVGKALNGGTKADGFSIVPHAFVVFVRIQEPAKTIRGWSAVRLLYTAFRHLTVECRPHLVFAQQGVMLKSLIPLDQVVEGGVDAAVTQNCRS